MTARLFFLRAPRLVPVREYVVTVSTPGGGCEARRVCLSDPEACDLALRLMELHNSRTIQNFSVSLPVDCTVAQLLLWLKALKDGGKDGAA